MFAKKVKLSGGKQTEVPCLVGLRDRAMMSILVYTAARAGAVSKLKRNSWCNSYHLKGCH